MHRSPVHSLKGPQISALRTLIVERMLHQRQGCIGPLFAVDRTADLVSHEFILGFTGVKNLTARLNPGGWCFVTWHEAEEKALVVAGV